MSLRKRYVSVGAALAFWMGNPVLNPATIVFMGFVLNWKYAVLRIAAGIVLVIGVAYFAGRLVKEDEVAQDTLEVPEEFSENRQPVGMRWIKAIWSLFWSIAPAYLLSVVILGGIRAWLFPSISLNMGNNWIGLILLAVAGTLFVIPTAAEIPIVKTMLAAGIGSGPAAALMMTLPAVSLPSLLMVRRVFPAKVLWFVSGMTALVGVAAGLIGIVWLS